MIKGFRDFLIRGNVIDLAVAVVIGAAFGAVVNSLVTGLITPIIGAVVGQPRSNFTLGPVQLGLILTAVVNFVLTAAAVYFLIVAPVNAAAARLRRPEPPAAPEPTREEVLLAEIRDLLRAR